MSYPDRDRGPRPGDSEPPRPPAYGQQRPVEHQPPAWQAAPQPKKKKWPWVVGLLALGLLLCGGGAIALVAAGGKAVNDAVQEVDDNAAGKNAVDTTLKKAARDGDFEFTVTAMRCGVKRVGPTDFGEKAQGQFCLVDVTVKNIGKEAQTFDGSSQFAYDNEGTEFSHDSAAATYANEDDTTFLEQINPGNQVKGTLVFDVPADAKITSVVLHDSMFSGGVRVKFAG